MNVLITRSTAQAAQCVNIFSSYGLFPYVLPMIDTIPADAPRFGYNTYDFCILASPSSVQYFSAYAKKLNIKKFIAVGSATAREISLRYGVEYNDILVPSAFYFDEIKDLLKDMPLQGKRILAPGAKARVQDINVFFNSLEAHFEAPVIYETVPVIYDKNVANSFITKYNINVVTFFSPSAVNAYISQVASGGNVRMVPIGATTQDALTRHGISSLPPPEQTAESMAAFIATLI